MSEAELANAAWWAWLWGEIEHWSFLAVVVFLAIEFAALKFGAPYKKILDDQKDLKIAELNKETARLRKQIAPRTLTGEQQKELAEKLKVFSGQRGTTKASPSTPEAEMFARALSAALHMAGWDVVPVQGTGTMFLFPTGVIVQYQPELGKPRDQQPSAAAEALASLLKSDLGIDATAIPGVLTPPHNIEITISSK